MFIQNFVFKLTVTFTDMTLQRAHFRYNMVKFLELDSIRNNNSDEKNHLSFD